MTSHGHAGGACSAALQGLGKTLQTIAFLAFMQAERGVGGPSLVVAPMSVLSSWMREFTQWAPHLRVVRIHSNGFDDKKRIRKEVTAHECLFSCWFNWCPSLDASCLQRKYTRATS
jgi:SNF2 family DNA or RNA helicase